MIVITMGFLICTFFVGFAAAFNANLLGKFKRPLPAKPEQYFDVNCINTHTMEDFKRPDQLQRCRALRPIDRPGPPLKFT